MGEFSGAFSDIAASVSLSDDAGLLAGFLQAGGKWGDDYRSTTVSGGLRYRW